MPRDDFTGQGKYQVIAKALNRLGAWTNHFRAAPPLLKREQNGSVALGVDPVAMAGLVLAELTHPFQLLVADDGDYTVQGGQVNTGQSALSVDGVSGNLPTGTYYWWVYLRYPNDGSTATAEVRHAAALPAADYETDDYPGSQSCDPVVPVGWAEVIIPIATLVDGVVTQHVFTDLYIPCGQTISVTRVLDHYWDGGTLKHVMLTETYVNGILRTVSGPSCKAVFDTGDCPEEDA